MTVKKYWILAVALTVCVSILWAAKLSENHKAVKPSTEIVLQPNTLPVFKTPDFSKIIAYPVVRIIDGDTIVVERYGEQVKVRLIGVDTPETVHPSKPVEHYGKEASRFTTNLLKGESVYLLSERSHEKTDRYGRTLAYVYRAPDGLFVNAEIIRQGYGHAYTRFPFKFMKEFRQFEQFARQVEKGLWVPVPNSKAKIPSALKTEKVPMSKLPPHKFSQPYRLGRARAQLRAIVPLQTYTKQELMKLAVQLAEIYKPHSAATLVQFFDDVKCLEGWDGTGLLRDSDWPHWLCRITVDTNSEGQLYARTFKLALNEQTGLPRKDVLREK